MHTEIDDPEYQEFSSLLIDNHLLMSNIFTKFTYPFRDAEGLILTKFSRYETD